MIRPSIVAAVLMFLDALSPDRQASLTSVRVSRTGGVVFDFGADESLGFGDDAEESERAPASARA